MSDIKEQFQTWLETYPLDGELRKEEYDLMCDSYIAGFESQQAEITRLTAIIKENEADAKRYRFMLDNDITDIYSDWVTYKLSPYYFDIVDLDKYIDQAMTDLVNPMLSIEAMRVKGE